MSPNKSMIKHVLKYGIVFGIASIILSLSAYLLGYYTKQGTIHITILFLVTAGSIIMGLLKFKKNNNGYIRIGEALKIAIGISLIGGLIAILWKVLLLHVIDPTIIDQLKEDGFKRLTRTSTELTQEKIKRRIALTDKYTTPIIMIYTALIEDLINGVIFGLVGGLIIRNKKRIA